MSFYRFRRRRRHRRYNGTRRYHRRPTGYFYIRRTQSAMPKSAKPTIGRHSSENQYSYRNNLRGGISWTHGQAKKFGDRATVIGGLGAAYGWNIIPSYLADRAQDAAVTGILGAKKYAPGLYTKHIEPRINRAFVHDEL